MTDPTAGQTTYGSADPYRLTTISNSQFTFQNSYDAAGNRTGLIYHDSRSVTYGYDDANRLDDVTASWLGGQFDYTYDDANRLENLSLPNSISSTYTYDDAGRLLRLANTGITGTLASYDYSLDQVGNRRVLTESLVTVQQLAAGTYLENNGQVVMEGEHGERLNGPTHQWNLKTSQSGYTGTSYLQVLPDVDTLIPSEAITTSPRVEYAVDFSTPNTYTVWLRGFASNAAGDSVHVGLDEQLIAITAFAPGRWKWVNTTTGGMTATLSITTTGVHTLSLAMREDGLRIDRLLLTTDTTYIPTDLGPAESERQLGSGSFITPLTRTIVYTYDNLYRLT